MDTVTSTQADRIAAHTARVVANMRAEADRLEAAGDVEGAETQRAFADSRERAGGRARVGAPIGRA